jgi:hypothetical protein
MVWLTVEHLIIRYGCPIPDEIRYPSHQDHGGCQEDPTP